MGITSSRSYASESLNRHWYYTHNKDTHAMFYILKK